MASLYPSIMRTYRIGPGGDRLGVLLSIVDRMTDLRLTHKAAMRTAPPGSLEAGRHNAIQAAMKLLINSAYGYMGAGSIALFADAHAADEVTRHGRELLGQVVEGLRARGVALIEADTDGVFFATPATWTEADERALVTAVGSSLPQGIYLEYEGRYQAMFSHEVKNYALLTYDGRLIVRGVALKSSRSEPFGERLLLKALRCVMTGDVVGARQAYLDTQAALRGYELSVHEVATRVRLSKSAKVYMQTRNRQREPQYEALLAAGRTRWSSGERVRFYRRRDGAYVWLPDKSDDAMEEETRPRDYDVGNYLQVLLQSYAGRLRKAFAPEDFQQLFRIDGQAGLFDQPVDQIQPVWIRP
jgi:DNA polymerase elongation subunit (family B)